MIMLAASKKSCFYAQGLRFSCKRCSACCRFEPGYVFLSQTDTSRLCEALGMQSEDFKEKYCRLIPAENNELRLSLKEKPNYDCIFWGAESNKGCQVYNARPLQCRNFPFWASNLVDKDSWDRTARDCPGMDQGELHSHDSIKKTLLGEKRNR